MANRNRTAGHNYERQITKEHIDMGFEGCVTARSESRNKDNLGIDIFDTTDKLPYDIQCKVSKGLTNKQVREFLDRGTKDKPLILFFKHVAKVGARFMGKGEYVYMSKETFYNLLTDKFGD